MIVEIYKSDNKVLFLYQWEGHEFAHTLTIPEFVIPCDDALFLISLFSRPKNDAEIFVYGAYPSAEVYDFARNSICSNIYCKILQNPSSVVNQTKELPKNTVLAFSGGFDSVAAMAILESTRLASVDYGGLFSRERKFFEKFETDIFHWDIRSGKRGKFNESTDWRFILAPLLLLRRPGENIGLATGTILESSPYWFSSRKRDNFTAYSKTIYGPFAASITHLAGVSEYATTLIVDNFLGDRIEESLESLAPANSFKLYRKKVLLETSRERNKFDSIDKPAKLHEYGKNFAEDYISMFLTYRHGINWVKDNYCHNMPNIDIDMSFFQRVNSENLKVIDHKTRNIVIEKLNHYGIKLTEKHDLENMKIAIDFRERYIKSNHSNPST